MRPTTRLLLAHRRKPSLTIAAQERREVITADVGGAYLNAYIPSNVLIHVTLDPVCAKLLCQIRPDYERFLRRDGTIVAKLERALYGCLESAKLWYDLLCKTLMGIGYEKSPVDPCVLNKDYEGCCIVYGAVPRR
jgi:hypothetical protein